MYFVFKYFSLIFVSLLCVCSCIKDVNRRKRGIKDTATNDPLMQLCGRATALVDRYWLVILLLVFGVFCFTRFIRLDLVPAGVHLDEIGYWYDAKNLATYGTDRMGSRYPVLPASYGDGHNPCYCYMCMVMLKIFPFSLKLMRAVMGISAIPCFFASFGIIYHLYESRRWALLGPIFVTITPYIFAANRWGLNANQMLYVCTVILYFLIRALKYGKIRDYILAGVFWGISLLTYHLSYIMMPLFFVLVFVYLIIVREFKWKNTLASFMPFALIGMPTFIEQLVNLGLVKPFYFLGSDYPKLISYRVGEIAPVNLIVNIGNILPLLFGDNMYDYNSVKEFGTVYWSMIPLIVCGAIIALILTVRSIKDRKLSLMTPVLLYGICIYAGFISVVGCNVYKANAIFICFILFAVAGLRYIAGYRDKYSIPSEDGVDGISDMDGEYANQNRFNILALWLVLAVLAISFLLYSEFYFRRMNTEYGFLSLFKSAEPGDMIVYEEASYNPDGEKMVYMELNYEDRDYCEWLLALYLDMPPEIFNAYDFKRAEMTEAGIGVEDIYKKVPFGHMMFAFPEEFDENEDAVYILGNNWGHIASYLLSIGFKSDTSFPGYMILYRN